MNYFVLVFDRESRTPDLREFAPTELDAAAAYRHERQLDALRTGADWEIVLFQAESQDALRRTHSSYFYTVEELADHFRDAAKAS